MNDGMIDESKRTTTKHRLAISALGAVSFAVGVIAVQFIEWLGRHA